MNMHGVFNVALAIVAVAGVTAVVSHPSSATVIKSIGDAFSGSIKAAIGG